MEAPSWLLEARTSEVERQEAQRGGGHGKNRVGSRVAGLWEPTLQPTSVPSTGWDPQGGWPQESLWRAAGAMFVGLVSHHSLTQALSQSVSHPASQSVSQ